MKNFKILTLLSFLLLFGCNSSIVDDPATKIRYSIPEKSYVNLTLENSYKTLIATLVDTVQFAGNYEVNFSINNLAEGIYFYTIEARGTNSDFYLKQTKYMMLVK